MREYGKIYSVLWASPTFQALTDDGKLLALYLLTCQHSTIAGVFRMPDGYAAEDLCWDVDRTRRAFDDLAANDFAVRCQARRWLWVVQHFKWNPLENPNQRKAAAKLVAQVPTTVDWWERFHAATASLLEPPTEVPVTPPGPAAQPAPSVAPTVAETVPQTPQTPPPEGSPNGSGNGSETVSKPFRNQEQEQEQEQEHRPRTDTQPGVSVDNCPDPSPYGAAFGLLRRLGVIGASPSDPEFRAMVDKAVTDDEWRAAVDKAARKGRNDLPFIVGVVKNQRRDAQAAAAATPDKPAPVVGVTVPGESTEVYLARKAAEKAREAMTPEQRAAAAQAREAAVRKLRRVKGRHTAAAGEGRA